MLGYPPTPPPPRGARQLTAPPADPKVWVNQGGGGAPPPPYSPQNGYTPLGVTHSLGTAPVLARCPGTYGCCLPKHMLKHEIFRIVVGGSASCRSHCSRYSCTVVLLYKSEYFAKIFDSRVFFFLSAEKNKKAKFYF